jgi:hypothetical protein
MRTPPVASTLPCTKARPISGVRMVVVAPARLSSVTPPSIFRRNRCRCGGEHSPAGSRQFQMSNGLRDMAVVIRLFVYPDTWPGHPSWSACCLAALRGPGPGHQSLDTLARLRPSRF